MSTLPFRRIILYKHGVGYFERRGELSGEILRLSFPLEAMDDVLKSLVALDLGAGQVLGVDFETPEDRDALLAKGSIHLSDYRSLLDLLRDLRGWQIRCVVQAGAAQETTSIEGLVVGIDYEDEHVLERALVSIYQPEARSVRSMLVTQLQYVELLDDTAAADLGYFLRAAQSERDRRSATLHLSPGEHNLLIGYIAPAPAWRVSYRLLFEARMSGEDEACGDLAPDSSVLLQGWGLFDNQLDEDLEGVHLTLVAGMPVSFRYRLYEPRTPVRPLVEDEERTVAGPISYKSAPHALTTANQSADEAGQYDMALGGANRARLSLAAFEEADQTTDVPLAEAYAAPSLADMEESMAVNITSDERGALFAYHVSHPVSVLRGQSAMVPILSCRLSCRRDLLYNGRKLPAHPVASLRLTNETGLTLERGPVTVLEEGDYAGEAIIPFTRSGGELIVPYAVELGIEVEQQHSSERRIASIMVRHEYLLIQEYDVQHTTYQLTSTLTQLVDVVVEYVSYGKGYELIDTPEPIEQGASFMRWSVPCAADTRTVFTVHERKMQTRHEAVRSLSGRNLQIYLANRFLDETTVRSLESVLQLYHQSDEAKQRLRQVSVEREAIYKHQRHIQGNLGPLDRDGEEGALRKRYVTELNRLEDQLTAFENEEKRLKAEMATLEQQAKEQLKQLSAGSG